MLINSSAVFRRVSRLTLSLALLAVVLPSVGRSEVAVSLGEQKARQKEDNVKGKFLRFLFWEGTGGPGHATLYVSELCPDGNYFKLRLCTQTDAEKGVYISFIGGLSSEHSWIAIPANIYLYGVEKKEDQPFYSTTFNSAYYAKIQDKRKAEDTSESFKENRISALDLARQTFLGQNSEEKMGGDDKKADKVNLYVSSERDVYDIIIHGDTTVEAKKLLEHFSQVPNLIKAPQGESEKVEGKFGYWNNCTATVNKWMSIMFGNEISITPSAAEVKIENPRHFARLFLEKIDQLRKNNKWDRDVSIEYVPKITSDRGASVGFGSPAQSLFDPRTIGGAMMWIHQTPFAATFLIANERNIRFNIKNPAAVNPSLEIEKATLAVKNSEGDEKIKNEAQLQSLRDSWFGTSADWEKASKRLEASYEAVKSNEQLPVELRSLIKNFGTKKGQFAAVVASIMAHRSQASRVDDVQYLAVHFKEGKETQPGVFEISGKDESVEYKTGVTAATIVQGDRPLSLMLMLAVVDNYVFSKKENRPSWPEMQSYLATLNKIVNTYSR